MLQLWGILLLLFMSVRVQGVRCKGEGCPGVEEVLLQCWHCYSCCAEGQESGRRGAAANGLMLYSMLRMGQVGYCTGGGCY